MALVHRNDALFKCMLLGHSIMSPFKLCLVTELLKTTRTRNIMEDIPPSAWLPLSDATAYVLYQIILARARCKTRRSPRLGKNICLLAMDDLSDREFRRAYRCTRASFDKLLNVVSQTIALKLNHARKDTGGAIPLRVRLAMTLRFLAGASYLDLCMLYGTAPGTFYKENGPIWETIRALDDCDTIEFDWSGEKGHLEDIAVGFDRCGLANGLLHGCVMAIDALLIRTRMPTKTETNAIMAYRNRKGFWGFPVLAGVDSKTRFTMWSHRTTGSTHDSMSWSVSDEFEQIKKLPPGYFVIGDEAFRNTNTFLVPWKGHSITAWKSSFNFHLSSMRQCVERAFGILVARWLILAKPLQVAKKKWTLISRVCAKLHNFLVTEETGSSQGSASQFWNGIRSNEDPANPPEFVLADNDVVHVPGAAAGDRRQKFTEDLERAGIRRPNDPDGTMRNL
eukprot:GSChrysophyteH2.ASY1.ANO1.115.1 assembled CDS